jgi:hypothetical protein
VLANKGLRTQNEASRLTFQDVVGIIGYNQERRKERMNDELRMLVREMGYDGCGERELERFFVEHNVSEEDRVVLLEEYEEGYCDW